MDRPIASAMRRALEHTRAGDPAAATRAIQDALGNAGRSPARQAASKAAPPSAILPPPAALPPPAGAARPAPHPGPAIEGSARRVAPHDAPAAKGLRMRMGEAVDLLRQGAAARLSPGTAQPAARPDLPQGARWERLRFAAAAGARDYRLFVPALADARPAGLVLMLHGCTQGPEDFAAGTRILDHAQRAGLIVVLPEQTRGDNAQGCWNWFRPGDQAGTGGEAALLAELALDTARAHGVPQDRIFAAGLSAGGAMAAILGAERPDVFSAIAVHSGLPAGAARDVAGAFAAMRSGGAAGRPIRARSISFHGTADATVAPANGRAVFASATGRKGADRSGMTGRPWRVTRKADAQGRPAAEHWEIDGLGHAWSGGDPRGSYADPQGPDATAQMVRFFLA
ncbi:hypothetical protein B0A89_04760 [Paracoccus contaminans]|uniref:Esterase n=2 Tax=Paracoccus contaminans TaxID=1945662 RepID=A0A1W6D0Q8_9RHOB|nr:hypothetical protein B0A89_04760 [Paracoccus contaminans]